MTTHQPSPRLRPIQRAKRVSFAPNTKFDRGRSSIKYYRGSEAYYDPGEHAAPRNGEWLNTSFLNEDYYNCCQLKVFSGNLDEVWDVMYSGKAPPRNEGIAEHHPRFNTICALIGKGYDGDEGMDTFAEDLKRADWILLSINESDGELLDVVLHETWDVEDPRYMEEEDSEDSDALYEPLSSSEEDGEEEEVGAEKEPRTPLRSLESTITAPFRPQRDRTLPEPDPAGHGLDPPALQPAISVAEEEESPRSEHVEAADAVLPTLEEEYVFRGEKRRAGQEPDSSAVKRSRFDAR